MILLSAAPPEASRIFRQDLKLSMPLVTDEEHQSSDHYDVPVEYRSPRAQVYAYGHIQPAVFAYRHNTEVYRFIQRPRWYNLGGAALRPTPDKVLRKLRRALR